ncbi:MAG: Uma2 family endonuclease, partial [Dolichospermum sp.]
KENLTGKWLRLWDEQGNLLLWGSELVTQKQQEIEQEKQRAEQEKQRADKLAAQLKALGIEPEN